MSGSLTFVLAFGTLLLLWDFDMTVLLLSLLVVIS